MTTTTESSPRDEAELVQIDQRYAALRLVEPDELSRLRGSIERMGMLHPVLVATAVDGGRLVLVDGFKRVRIATDRGDATMWVRRSAMDGMAAKVAMIAANAGHRGLADVEEAWIVHSLRRDHALTQVQIGKALRRDKSWVCRRLMLAERLEASLQEDIRLGLLSATVARELARLPRGNQVAMAAAIRAHGLTSRQAHRVVTELLRTSDPGARAEVLADPHRYLGGIERPAVRTTDPRLSKRANELRERLLMVAGTSDRCTRAVAHCAPTGLVGDDARILAPIAERALRSTREAVAAICQLVKDNGAP
jgi:ParB-like chromosome segregation protein Spo0J